MANKNKRKRTKPEDVPEPDAKDLERFAGSSEEEPENDSGDEEEPMMEDEVEEETTTTTRKKTRNERKDKKRIDAKQESSDEGDTRGRAESDEFDVDGLEHNDEHDDGEGETGDGPTGMADAIARILGTQQTPGSTRPVVLSKTTTPLQRIAQQEKERDKELREKRKANRERRLAAFHVPLSVATTASVTPGGPSSSSSSLVKELEMERTHRRVATRGVVALFNAIAQHQKKAQTENMTKLSTGGGSVGEQTKHLTKHGFLDMIKSKAAEEAKTNRPASDNAGAETNNKSLRETPTGPSSKATKAPTKWNALKDDYLLNSKLKDWDKESSEEEEEEGRTDEAMLAGED